MFGAARYSHDHSAIRMYANAKVPAVVLQEICGVCKKLEQYSTVRIRTDNVGVVDQELRAYEATATKFLTS